jgi:hypothetical protein
MKSIGLQSKDPRDHQVCGSKSPPMNTAAGFSRAMAAKSTL